MRFLLAELGLQGEHRLVKLHEPTDDYRSVHPFGLVPNLIDGDLAVTESNVALRFLGERACSSDLRGDTPARRARIEILLDSLSLEVRPHLWPLERLIIYGQQADEHAIEDARRNRECTLTAYDSLLDPIGPYALGRFTIAECAITGRLHYLQRLGSIPAARSVFGALARTRAPPAWAIGIAAAVASPDPA